MILTESKLHDWSFNRELVRRLERSFLDQGVDAAIQKAAITVAIEVRRDLKDFADNIHEHVDAVAEAIRRPDLKVHMKGDDNG